MPPVPAPRRSSASPSRIAVVGIVLWMLSGTMGTAGNVLFGVLAAVNILVHPMITEPTRIIMGRQERPCL
jgi:hypothetical protein